MSSSAVDRALNVAELIENILIYLPIEDVLMAQCLNTTFRDAIAESPMLQRMLFFRTIDVPTSGIEGEKNEEEENEEGEENTPCLTLNPLVTVVTLRKIVVMSGNAIGFREISEQGGVVKMSKALKRRLPLPSGWSWELCEGVSGQHYFNVFFHGRKEETRNIGLLQQHSLHRMYLVSGAYDGRLDAGYITERPQNIVTTIHDTFKVSIEVELRAATFGEMHTVLRALVEAEPDPKEWEEDHDANRGLAWWTRAMRRTKRIEREPAAFPENVRSLMLGPAIYRGSVEGSVCGLEQDKQARRDYWARSGGA